MVERREKSVAEGHQKVPLTSTTPLNNKKIQLVKNRPSQIMKRVLPLNSQEVKT